jgi:hypothetical protein
MPKHPRFNYLSGSMARRLHVLVVMNVTGSKVGIKQGKRCFG